VLAIGESGQACPETHQALARMPPRERRAESLRHPAETASINVALGGVRLSCGCHRHGWRRAAPAHRP